MKKILILFFLFICINISARSWNTFTKMESVLNVPVLNKDFVYIYENDTLIQTVNITIVNEKGIEFQLFSENKIRNQIASIEGVAIKNIGDAEIDEDEEGNAYPVDEYIYEGDCWLSFRIDMETHTTMKIKLADCTSNQYCPFSSIELLKKQ